jgi:hypothetical protein
MNVTNRRQREKSQYMGSSIDEAAQTGSRGVTLAVAVEQKSKEAGEAHLACLGRDEVASISYGIAVTVG